MRKGLGRNTNQHIVRIPPFPPAFVLTDRADGKLWLLTHNLTEASPDGEGYISITDVIPAVWYRLLEIQTFPADDGPVVNTDPVSRLLIRGGDLGFEILDFSVQGTAYDRSERLIQTRKGVTRKTRRIHQPSTSWAPLVYTLAWTPEDLKVYP